MLCSEPTSTNNKNNKRVIRSNKRKAAVVSADDEVCKEVTGNNIKRVFRNGRYRLLCSFDGCTHIAQKEGVCIKHGASWTKRTCSHEGCNSLSRGKEGVCAKHGAKVNKSKRKCSHEGCDSQVVKGGVGKRHGTRQICDHQGCKNVAKARGVCKKHDTKA